MKCYTKNKDMKRDQYIPYLVCAFLLGFFATINQVILIREFLSVLYGNELILAMIFTMWFGGITAGALSASFFRKKKRGRSILPVWLVGILPLIGFLQVCSVRILRNVWHIQVGQLMDFWHSALSVMIIVVPFSFLVGVVFPLLSDSIESYGNDRPPLAAGKIYWIESMGSLFGGIVFTFVFAGRVPALVIEGFCLIAGLMLISFNETQLDKNSSRKRTILAYTLLLLCVFFNICGYFQKADRKLSLDRWSSIAPGFEFVSDYESRYQYLSIGKREGQYALFEDGLLISVFPDPYEISKPVHLYMNERPGAKSILLMGLGLEGEVQKILSYDVGNVTFVFLNQAYKALIFPLLNARDKAALDDPRLHIRIADPVRYLSTKAGMFDIIVLHPPPPATAAYSRFYTKSFFNLCKNIYPFSRCNFSYLI